MSSHGVCERCSRSLRAGYRQAGGVGIICWRCAVRHPPVLRRSFITALIVGTLLTTINQGDHLLHGELTAGTVLKIALTYCVPFGVSTSGALGAARVQPEE
jgi:hypothetical protein